ncbi:hypothetical protein [Candidatus Palauibacter irciniicola]|uniref:hypothetical protein n=1 Tax=Candidatus Palauibacter irciniicola TaxID=3056733 RepID=UPI003B010E46
MSRLIWRAIWVVAAVALVVVPFGYAITEVHRDVLMGAGCGLAIGVGIGLRGGAQAGPWMGILIGSIVGISTALIAGVAPWDGFLVLVPPILALAVGMHDGLRETSFSRYRDMSRETFIVSALLALGFFLARIVLGELAAAVMFAVAPFVCMPWIALISGILSHRRQGWQDTRPPRLLVLSAVLLFATLLLLLVDEQLGYGRVSPRIVPILLFVGVQGLALAAVTAATFLLGRVGMMWLQPRLRVYGRLAEYLRIMWVPIGGFAVGYLMIIVLFAGFYGMLERFSPGAFADAAVGIKEWIFFAFFTGLAQDYATIAPVSDSARALVGLHLILSAGWIVVLFAAVMSFMGPRLDRIARRHAEEES